MERAETGRRGEAAAARFYEKQGAALITHNYHTRMGEIDLILREPDGTLVFCEVKTRAKDSLDTPAAAVNAAKQGYVDDVIEPAVTRQMLCSAIEMLSGKRDSRPAKKHGNMPL